MNDKPKQELEHTKNEENTSPQDGKREAKHKPENFSPPRYVTANPLSYGIIKAFREELKNNPTPAEKILWGYLRNKKTGYKIRRQHVIDDFITDFVCLVKKVVIEIDGKIHLSYKEYDELRTFRLNQKGYEVIRFTNEEVYSNPELVAQKIKQKLDEKVVASQSAGESA